MGGEAQSLQEVCLWVGGGHWSPCPCVALDHPPQRPLTTSSLSLGQNLEPVIPKLIQGFPNCLLMPQHLWLGLGTHPHWEDEG